MDGEDLGQQETHLRWFILDDSCRGSGIGRRLLSEAMAFCDSRQFSAVQSCGPLKGWTRPANCMNPLASR
ncbi:GNAT family N-acetyltransferase [Klebsiella pneumoniae subsp. pneumoniae]|nr:GNAT family N-acetyltransferase [Klebsiella pneumoniae subsp. pneumoniae]